MKSNSVILSPVIGLLIGSLSLSGESLLFQFQDTAFEEFGVSYAFGDVVNGVVVMDTDSGAFSVTWNASGVGFLSPIHLTLHMINPSAENMVTISGFWEGKAGTDSVTFSSWDEGFETTGGLTDWEAGQTVFTSGSFENSDYISGTYSKDFIPVDSIQVSGQLVANPDESQKNIQDIDSDGISDDLDEWNESDTSEKVHLLGVKTRIPNRILNAMATESGHTLADIVQLLELAASEDALNHGQYVQEMVRSYRMLVKDGLISEQDNNSLIRIVVEHGK
jgi:hypothetical protein